MATADSIGDEHEEPDQREMPTAVWDQNLVIDGWMASHADSGTPGPHVRLWAPGSNGVVLRTDQIPELIASLEAAAHRIDKLWAEQGANYIAARENWVDANDPDVIRQRRIDDLLFVDKIHDHLIEVATILLEAKDIHDASSRIATLVGVDVLDVKSQLDRVPLFSLTRTPTATRETLLRQLRQRE